MKKLTPLLLNQVHDEEATLLSLVIDWSMTQSDVFVIRITDKYHKGYSDIFACVNGIFVAAELKDKDGAPSIHQKIFVKNIVDAGGIGKVDVRTLGEYIELIEEARHARR